MNKWQHWKLDKGPDNIFWFYLDKKNSAVNTFDLNVLNELEQVLDVCEKEAPKGIVFASKKASGFIAGADIEAFTHLKDSTAAKDFIQRGQNLFTRIANLPMPTLALIEGFCLGGGLEFALACRYRIAENSLKTRLGLPEVLLGIHPGWGGSVRLPALVGASQALNMILSGKTKNAKTACKLGLVDAAVPKRQLQHAAQFYLTQQPKPHQASLCQRLSNAAVIRPLLAQFVRRTLAQKANPKNYPAPYAVLDNWQRYGVTLPQAMDAEAGSLANCVLDPTAKNLVRLFFLQERLKGLAKDTQFTAQHIHVIGAGTMGGDIAAWCVLQGKTVTLQDQSTDAIASVFKRAYQLARKKLKDKRLIQQALDRLIPDSAGNGVAKADVMIEAIFEDLTTKRELIQTLEKNSKPEAIIATNTSSIPLDDINSVLKQPERLVGIHFFNPVVKMQIVEVVAGKVTDAKVLQHALAFVQQIKRLPLPVKSSPGFLVNRILMPYLLECVDLLREGVPAAAIDKAAEDFGMLMGPIEMADVVGLDICLAVAENLTQHYGGEIPATFREMVARGDLGKKTGQGFYRYKKGKPIKNLPANYKLNSHVADRLMMRYLNESAACLREKVIDDADLLNVGMVFATGFAPFRGGPLQYSRDLGIDQIQQTLLEFQQTYGERFKPDPLWGQKLN